MKLFDSHCHLDDPAYGKDVARVIERAHQNGVMRMLTVGVNQKTALRGVSLAEAHADLYASVGFHPHDASQCHSAALDLLKRLAQNPKVRAWGEIGLDYNRMYSPRKDQEKWFIRQLEIAAELNLPVIFHERDSNGRFLEILKLHLKKEQTITGILTIEKRGSGLRQMVPRIPVDRLVVETDAPYLTPAPEKNHTRRNEPAFVKSVLLKLAEVRAEDPHQLAQIVWDNTNRLYRIE
jgi:TatD DNase family protein